MVITCRDFCLFVCLFVFFVLFFSLNFTNFNHSGGVKLFFICLNVQFGSKLSKLASLSDKVMVFQ